MKHIKFITPYTYTNNASRLYSLTCTYLYCYEYVHVHVTKVEFCSQTNLVTIQLLAACMQPFFLITRKESTYIVSYPYANIIVISTVYYI